MTPTNLRRIGPFVLRLDEDADVIRALDASGNKAGLIRACIRLAMNARGVRFSPMVEVQAGKRAMVTARIDEAVLAADEWALIERAREAK